MALSPQARQLVHQLGTLHTGAMNGDREAVAQCAGIARKAAAGDSQAITLRNTLAVIHWKRRDKTQYNQAEAFYQRLVQGDALARQQLQDIVNRLRQGDNSVRPLFSTLRAIHRKQKASAWSGPGEPKTGHYPMPQYHRPGIIVGGSRVGCAGSPVFGGSVYFGASYPALDAVAVASLLALIARARVSVPSDFSAMASSPQEAPAVMAPEVPSNNPLLQGIANAVKKTPPPVSKTLAMTSVKAAPSMSQVAQVLRANYVKLN